MLQDGINNLLEQGSKIVEENFEDQKLSYQIIIWIQFWKTSHVKY